MMTDDDVHARSLADPESDARFTAAVLAGLPPRARGRGRPFFVICAAAALASLSAAWLGAEWLGALHGVRSLPPIDAVLPTFVIAGGVVADLLLVDARAGG